jgi:hypothetical protein
MKLKKSINYDFNIKLDSFVNEFEKQKYWRLTFYYSDLDYDRVYAKNLVILFYKTLIYLQKKAKFNCWKLRQKAKSKFNQFKYWFSNTFSACEFKYAIKCLSYIFHPFVGLQAQRMEDVYDNDGQTVINQKSVWVDIDADFTWCEPYYVCAVFSNGKHLPLPLLLESKGDYWMQNIILSVMRRMGLLTEAQRACQLYIDAC